MEISLFIKNTLPSLMSVVCLGSAARWVPCCCLFVCCRSVGEDCAFLVRHIARFHMHIQTHGPPPPVRRTRSPWPARPLPAARRRIVSQSRSPTPGVRTTVFYFSGEGGGWSGPPQGLHDSFSRPPKNRSLPICVSLAGP